LQKKALMKSHFGLLKCYPCPEEVIAFPGAQLHKVSGGNGENLET